jgi:hypothetical protein
VTFFAALPDEAFLGGVEMRVGHQGIWSAARSAVLPIHLARLPCRRPDQRNAALTKRPR